MTNIQGSDDILVVLRTLASFYRTDAEEIASSAGLPNPLMFPAETSGMGSIRDKIREMTEVLDCAQKRFPDPASAYSWYRTKPLPGMGGVTAMELVRAGRAGEVMDIISAVDAGVHA